MIIIILFTAEVDRPREPCNPSPCGPNSQCRVNNGQAVCTCLPNYTGSPPGCRPECVASSECPSQLACINQKCENPCPSPCGIATKCIVVNHSPICTCMPGYSGDPFTRCTLIPPRKHRNLQVLFNLAFFFTTNLSLSTIKLLQLSNKMLRFHEILAHSHPVEVLPTAVTSVVLQRVPAKKRT